MIVYAFIIQFSCPTTHNYNTDAKLQKMLYFIVLSSKTNHYIINEPLYYKFGI